MSLGQTKEGGIGYIKDRLAEDLHDLEERVARFKKQDDPDVSYDYFDGKLLALKTAVDAIEDLQKAQPTLPAEKRRLLVVLAYQRPWSVRLRMYCLGYGMPHATMPTSSKFCWVIATSNESLYGLRDVDFYIHSSFHSAPAWVQNPMMQTVNMLVASNFATILKEIPRRTEQ